VPKRTRQMLMSTEVFQVSQRPLLMTDMVGYSTPVVLSVSFQVFLSASSKNVGIGTDRATVLQLFTKMLVSRRR